MGHCPFANLLGPDTYAQGMPYDKLKEIREAGPVECAASCATLLHPSTLSLKHRSFVSMQNELSMTWQAKANVSSQKTLRLNFL